MGPLARALFGCLALSGCARLSGFEAFTGEVGDASPGGAAGGVSGGAAGSDAGTAGGGAGGGAAGTAGGAGTAGAAGGLPAWPSHCFDAEPNGDETDTDCGGSCPRCARERTCKVDADCWNGECAQGSCTINCPESMARIYSGEQDAFCVDEYEVTQQEYRAFLMKNPSRDRQDPVCAVRNESFEPRTSSPVTTTRDECTKNTYRPTELPQRPVSCVDYCDAVAYCREQGKFLCGEATKPGKILIGVNYAGIDAFYTACTSDNESNVYPYGATYAPKTCNTKDYGSLGSVDVGKTPACKNKTSPTAAFNLVGNVAEWTTACVPGDGAAAPDCMVRGGSYVDGETTSRCSSSDKIRSTDAFADVGFRCCG